MVGLTLAMVGKPEFVENSMKIQLNPAHDAAQLADSYSEQRRLQVREFFTVDTAEGIYQDLIQVPWHLAFNEGKVIHELTPQQLASLSSQDAADIQRRVYSGAQQGYQFLYNHFPLSTEYFRQAGTGQALFKLYEFINRPGMLNFFRALTGISQIGWADAHATLYRAGHFLKFHTDENPGERRLAAYVLNFTKGWGRDWGGLLQFWDKNYDVEFAYRPVFNALNIFTVPADHSVSAVVPYCSGLRLSVTGWLREGDPNGLINGWQKDEAQV